MASKQTFRQTFVMDVVRLYRLTLLTPYRSSMLSTDILDRCLPIVIYTMNRRFAITTLHCHTHPRQREAVMAAEKFPRKIICCIPSSQAPSKDNRKYSPLALRRNRSSTSKQSSTSVSLASSSAGSRLQTPPRSGSRSNIKGHSSSIRCSDSQESALSETSSVSSLSRASKRRRKHWAELLSMLSCSSILPGVLSTSSTSRPAYLADDLFSQAALSWKPTAACAADSGGGCEGTGVGRCSMVGRKRSSSTVVNATCSRNLSTLTSAVKQLKSGL